MIPTQSLLEIVNMVCLPENRINRLELTLHIPSGSGNLYLRMEDVPREGDVSYHQRNDQRKKNLVNPTTQESECSYPLTLRPEYVEITASSSRVKRILDTIVPSWTNEEYWLVSASFHQSPDYAVLLEIKNNPPPTTSKNGVYRRRELRKHPERISNWPEIVAYCEEQTIPIYDCRFR